MSAKSNDSIRENVERAGQGHVFTYWQELTDEQREALWADLALVNLNELPRLMRLICDPPTAQAGPGNLEPAPVIRQSEVSADIAEHGRELLREGKVAAFTVAGGQGTRLGFDGPKGAFAISPVCGKSLFQLFAEFILASGRRYGRSAPWYIMTSPSNDVETRRFFEKHEFFGIPAGDVIFFSQGVMPVFDAQGRILLEEKHRLALSPDGHGGSLLAMARSGVLAEMARRGIEHISYFQVDNPLVACLDPMFIGLHDRRRSELSSKVVPKADNLERVGNFLLADGKLAVIEYTDLPETLARARNPDGSRKFDAANIAIHLLSRKFIERLTRDGAAFGLPWHLARKKVPHIDHSSGRRIDPIEPNAVKLEAFIFDALPLAENPILVETSRGEEFSPVKNATGVDSVATSKADMSCRAARWLQKAGVDIPRGASGQPDGVFEISPLVALDAEQLAASKPGGKTMNAGGRYYFGPES